MDSTKWWLDSTTVRNALMTYIPSTILILGWFGVSVQETEIMTIITGLVGLVGMISTTLAIIGRIEAKEKLSFKKDNLE